MWLVKQDLAQVQWQMDGSHGNTSDTMELALSLWVCNLLLIGLTAKMQFNDSTQKVKPIQVPQMPKYPFAAKNINECCMWRKVPETKRTLYQYSTSRCQTGWRPSSGAWPLCLLLASSHWWHLTKLIKQFQHVSTCLIKQLWQSRARYASTILSMCSNFCPFLLYLYLPYFVPNEMQEQIRNIIQLKSFCMPTSTLRKTGEPWRNNWQSEPGTCAAREVRLSSTIINLSCQEKTRRNNAWSELDHRYIRYHRFSNNKFI